MNFDIVYLHGETKKTKNFFYSTYIYKMDILNGDIISYSTDCIS